MRQKKVALFEHNFHPMLMENSAPNKLDTMASGAYQLLHANWPRPGWEAIGIGARYMVNLCTIRAPAYLYHCWNNKRYQRNYSVHSYPLSVGGALRVYILMMCLCAINCWLNLSATFFPLFPSALTTIFSFTSPHPETKRSSKCASSLLFRLLYSVRKSR